jgi:site-specific recombinase XerD
VNTLITPRLIPFSTLSILTKSRDRALLGFLYNTGARVQETVDVPDDLRLDDLAQVKLCGNGKKHRACSLWPDTAEHIKDVIKTRRPVKPETDGLFLNARGEPITRSSGQLYCQKICQVGWAPMSLDSVQDC